ncbi:MAG TPA: thioredoxin family protein [Opitutaceae bacterium]
MNTKPLRRLAVGLALFAFATGCTRTSEAPATATASVEQNTTADTTAAAPPAPAVVANQPAPEKRLPRMVDIGAGTCIPCRLMKPILDDLMTTRADQFETVFVDLNHEREKGMSFRIRLIPTQIFFDENGRELRRHEGFFSKEEILKTWENLGYKFEPTD